VGSPLRGPHTETDLLAFRFDASDRHGIAAQYTADEILAGALRLPALTRAGRPAVVSYPHPFEQEVCEMLGDATMPAPVLLPTGQALATLAHELRDPLAAIVLALELHSGGDDPAARRTLTMAAH